MISTPERWAFRYIDLVGAHTALATQIAIKLGIGTELVAPMSNGYRIPLRRDEPYAQNNFPMMKGYVDCLSEITEFMKEKGFNDERKTLDAWWTLMLRAICWQDSVSFIEGGPGSIAVPSSLYGSRIPVFIT